MKALAPMICAIAALALIATAQAQTPAPAPATIVTDDLPSAPERELVAKTCTGCHASAQFTHQRLSRDEWKESVVKMIGYGADIPEDKEPLIVDYLAKHFPPAK